MFSTLSFLLLFQPISSLSPFSIFSLIGTHFESIVLGWSYFCADWGGAPFSALGGAILVPISAWGGVVLALISAVEGQARWRWLGFIGVGFSLSLSISFSLFHGRIGKKGEERDFNER